MENKIWDLFKLTGNIKYYMMYKEMEKEKEDEPNQNKRNNNQ